MKISGYYSLPLLQKFVLEFKEDEDNRIIEEKDKDTLRASQFQFPKYAPRHTVPPQHLNQRNGFRIQLKNLKINNRNWLFLVRQVLIYFHTMRLQHVRRT